MVIKHIEKKYRKEEILEKLEKPLTIWFINKFKDFTPPQKKSIIPILENKNVLITSPTGSGKTLACFLAIINNLIKLSHQNKLEDFVYCIYISPLRALDRDIYWNLLEPLKEIEEICGKIGYKLNKKIRVALRTGDVKPHEKQKQLKEPPHILITTPETIAIVLGTIKFKEKLKNVKYVIIDEIHELANSKRGIHLSLSLERLENLCGKKIVRIGAGATLEPLELAAKFLVGEKRSCYIVDARFLKKTDIKVVIPVNKLIYTEAEKANEKMYQLLDKLITNSRTTLVFTNTRSGAERVHWHLKQLFPSKYLDEITGVHHSSISRDIRFDVEEKLKSGKLKAVISSTSLELGIDIGYIDLVVQIGSPKSVSRLMQRIGRAGHVLHEISKGRVICLDRDDLVECLVMVKKSYEYWLDKFHMPRNCLDVLCQHIVGMALEKKWKIEEAYNLIKKAYPYSNLKFKDFLSVLRYLAGYYHTLINYNIYGKIWLDEGEKIFGRMGKYTRVIYTLNIGTIPDEVKIKVRTIDGKFVGFIEESFLERLMPSDIFVLGGKTYEFVKSKRNVAYVVEAKEKKPTIPSWFSEQLPLSYELAIEIGKFREKIFKMIENNEKEKIIEFLEKEYFAEKDVAKEIYDYFLLQYNFLKYFGIKEFHSDKNVIVENVVDEKEGVQNIIFHSLYGRRVNDCLSRAYAYALSKKINKSVKTSITDNGFILSFELEKERKGIFGYKYKTINSEKVVSLVNKNNIEELVRKSLLNTELIKRKFRHCASRSYMILKNYKGHEISVEKQQINAEKLIKIVKDLEDFPVLKETYREILEDFMDIEKAKEVLSFCRFIFLPKTNLPSPFAHNIFILSETDVVLMEDRRKLLLELHKKILEKIHENNYIFKP
ncbi:MAG: ATP-dependent helicase [Candidatus Aenigmarchaeota archaeon]|nr:ATP-dependent helicase [Candidatus Aenigmarchaeota archaeon]MDW8149121.1 ATP-dependent helicase [Candidatus Aenigmarchaeota archaeon]